MRGWVFGLLLAALAARSDAKLHTEYVDYQAGGVQLRGYLAWDDGARGQRPAVLVVHEWWGLTEHPRRSAERLAGLGYVAFALDMYGGAKTAANPDEAGKLASAVRSDPAAAAERFEAALALVRANPNVDGKRVAAIGFCFGGTVALDMARRGVDLSGVVSFHGGLATQHPAPKGGVKARVLALHGADDPLVPPAQVQAFEQEMREAGADWQLKAYGGAEHAFTNPAANSPGVRYNERAARRSWEDMKLFLRECFG